MADKFQSHQKLKYKPYQKAIRILKSHHSLCSQIFTVSSSNTLEFHNFSPKSMLRSLALIFAILYTNPGTHQVQLTIDV